MTDQNKRPNNDSRRPGDRKPARLEVESLEPRILMSATWTDVPTGQEVAHGTSHDEIYLGDSTANVANALGGEDQMYGFGGNDQLDGGYGDDMLDGGDGDDTLDGGGGHDLLVGGQGNDTLHGGAGNDTLRGGPGNNTLDGEGGADAVDYSDATSGVHVDITHTGAQDTGGGGVDSILNVEGVTGSSHNDTFSFANAVNNDKFTVDGGAGFDRLDLSGHSASDVTFNPDGHSLSVHVGTGTQHFDVDYTNIEQIQIGADHAPTATAGSMHFNEDTSSAVHLTGSDPDSWDAVDSFRIDSLPTHGSLELNGHAVTAGTTISKTDVDSGALVFHPDADWNGSTAFNFSAHDGELWSTAPASFNLHVDAVNDAPFATAGSHHFNEDTTGVVHLAGFDSDAGDAVDSYRIDTLPTDGTLMLDGVAVDAHATVTQAQIDGGALTFHPTHDWSGSTSFTFSAFDGQAYSAAPATFDLHVDAVNDAPVALDGSLELHAGAASADHAAEANAEMAFAVEARPIHEDTGNVITLTGTDPDNGDAVEGYRIDELPDSGTLLLNGSAIKPGMTVTQSEIDKGALTFHPADDRHGSTAFSFSAFDGEAYSETPAKFSLTLHGDNEAPVAIEGSLNMNEDTTTVITLAGKDPDKGDAVEGYRIDELPESGTLLLYGAEIKPGTTVTQTEIDKGALTFHPADDWNGSTSFRFSAFDGEAYSADTATFDLHVDAVNDAPTAAAGHLSLNEDATATITLSGTDIDAGDAVESYRIDTLPTNGTLFLHGSALSAGATVTQAEINHGDLTFHPTDNWNGSTNFTFSAHDGDAWSASPANFGLTVNAVNDAPTANVGSVNLNEDTTTAVMLSGADIDAGDAVEAYRVDTLPSSGTLLLNGHAISAGTVVSQADIDAGHLVFSPNADWHGLTSFTFSASDGESWSAHPAVFDVTVDPVNDLPSAAAGSANLNEDATAVVTLSGIDPDSGDAVEAYRIDSLPSDGALLLNGHAIAAGATVTQAEIDGGALVFQPAANWHGWTSFSFSAGAGDAWSAGSATFGLTVNAVNDAPTATHGSLAVNEDGAGVVTLSGADVDAGDAVESYRIDTLPTNGTLLLNGSAVSAGASVTQAQINSGALTFHPTANWNGSTNFTFSAHDGEAWSTAPGVFDLNVNPVNDAPTTTAGSMTLNEDVTSVVTLSGADIDAGDSIETYRIETLPTNGTLELNGSAISAGATVTQAQIDSGALTFHPAANWSGSTSFTFRANDGDAWSAAPATFGLTVNSVNDAPVPTAGSLTVNEDSSGIVKLAGTDVDAGDAVTSYRVDTLPANGSLLLNGTALSAGATITQAQINSNALTFRPTANFNGMTSFTFSANDGDTWSTAPGTFGVTVNPVNDAPTATAGNLTMNEDATGVVTLSGSDVDAGDSIETFRVDTLPTNGTLLLNGSAVSAGTTVTHAQIDSGALTFHPNANWNGATSFQFSAHDGDVWSAARATFGVTVSPVNDAPTATNVTLTINEDATGTIKLAGTDIDAGDAVTSYRVDTLPEHGTLLLNGAAIHAGDTVTQAQISGNQLTFRPDTNWNGSTNFTFSAHDGDVYSAAPATFNLNVNAVNDAPTANAGSLAISEDGSGVVTLTGADVDAGDAVDAYRINTLPANGQLLLNGAAVTANTMVTQAQIDSGALTFHPNANWNGSTSFSFSAYDGQAYSSAAATYGLTVSPVNDAPTATNVTLTINEDATGTVKLAGADIDAGDAVTSYRVDTLPEHGTLLLNGTAIHAGDSVTQAQISGNQLTFRPDANWNGSTNFAFSAHDGDVYSAAPATFNLNVTAVNDAPTANAGSMTINEDGTGVVTLTGADVDAGDAVDAYRINNLPANGQLLLNGTAVTANTMVTQAQIDSGALTFHPNANWNGSTSFSFSAYDGQAYSTAAAFGVTVSPVNDAPTATTGTLTINEDATGVVKLAGADIDAGDAVTSYRVDTLPANGTLLLNGTAIHAGDSVTQAQITGNQLTFRPNTNWNGSTNFTFSAHDGDAYSAAPGTFNLNVTAVNDAPTSNAGSLNLNEDSTGVITLTGADVDAGDGVDAYRISTLPANGTLMLNGAAVARNAMVTQAQIDGGALTFRPNANWNGSTSFTFNAYDGQAYSTAAGTFSLTVNPVNDAPVATAGSASLAEDATRVITLAGTDPDAGDAVDSYRVDTLPAHGTLYLNGSAIGAGASVSKAEITSGALTFRPTANWNGSTSFSFSAFDGDAYSAAPATFNLTVTPVNDAATPTAGSLTMNEDGTSVVTLSATDVDAGDVVSSYRISTLPSNGTLLLNGSAIAANATVTQAQIDSGALTFRPNANWNGSTSFNFNAYDGHVWSTTPAAFSLNVNPVNDAPTATAGNLTMNEDATGVITLAGADIDASDTIESYRIDTLPTNGTLMLHGSAVSAGATVTQAEINGGELTFEPAANWNGSTSFSFSAHDGDVWSAAPAAFNLTVNAVNDAPTATGGSLTVDEDAHAVITLSGADVDAGDSVESYRIDTLPAHGTLLLNGTAVGAGTVVTQADVDSGHLSFAPAANWNGSTSFAFSASDGHAWSAAAGNFDITVNPVNDAPTALHGSLSINEDAAGVISLVGSDIDSGDAVENYRIDTLPDHGTLLLNGHAIAAGDTVTQAEIDGGALSFHPDANWNGSTSLTFSASDGEAWSAAPAVFDLTVHAVNDAPTATAGGLELNEDATGVITLAGADIDSGDAVESYRIDTLPEHGALVLNGHDVHAGDVVTQAQIDSGELVFRPEGDWNGSTSFEFSTSDGDAWSASTAAFGLTVHPVNDAPLAAHGSLTLDEDSTGVVTLAGSDIDGGDAVEGYRIDTLPDHGTLLLDGHALAAGAVVTQAQVDSGALNFHPDADWHGATSFNFSTSDGESWSTSGAAMDITVNDVAGPAQPTIGPADGTAHNDEFRPQWNEHEDLRVLDPNTYNFGSGEPLQTIDKAESLIAQHDSDQGEHVYAPSGGIEHSYDIPPMAEHDVYEPGPVALNPVTEVDDHGNAVPVEIVYDVNFDYQHQQPDGAAAVKQPESVETADAPAVGMLWGLMRGFAGTRTTTDTANGPSEDRKAARR